MGTRRPLHVHPWALPLVNSFPLHVGPGRPNCLSQCFRLVAPPVNLVAFVPLFEKNFLAHCASFPTGACPLLFPPFLVAQWSFFSPNSFSSPFFIHGDLVFLNFPFFSRSCLKDPPPQRTFLSCTFYVVTTSCIFSHPPEVPLCLFGSFWLRPLIEDLGISFSLFSFFG